MSTLYDRLYYPQTVSIEEYGRVCLEGLEVTA